MRIKIPAKLEKNRREEHFTQENISVTSKQLKGFEDAEYSKKEPYVIYYIRQWFGTESVLNPVTVQYIAWSRSAS